MLSRPLFRFKLNHSALEFAVKNKLPTEYEVHRADGMVHKLKVAWKNKDGIYQSVIYKSSVVNENLNSGYWEQI